LEHSTKSKGSTKFSITTADDSNTVYCRGRINALEDKSPPVKLDDEFSGRDTELKIGSFYGELRTRGLEYGARFANVRELWQGKAGSGEAIGRVTDTSIAAQNMNDPYKNAILLDGCLHVFGAALNMLDEVNNQAGAFVPASIQSITIQGELPAQVWSHVTVSANGDKRGALAHVRVLSDAGDVLVEFNNLELRHTLSLSLGKKVNTGSSTANKFFKSREHLLELLRPMTRKERVSLLSKWMTAEIVDTMGQAAAGLNLEKLPPSTAFLEIGLDSLLVTELQRRIQERLEFRFKPMQGLDYQSIESLAAYIHDEVLLPDLEPAGSEVNSEVVVSEAAD
jgi:acyl carrier protein